MGSGAEEMNSCQQQAQIAPALCCEGAGREQGEQEGGMGSWAFQSGLMGLQEMGDQPGLPGVSPTCTSES